MSIKRTCLTAFVAVLVAVGIAEAPAASAAPVSNVTFTTTNPVAGTTADWSIRFTPSNGAGGELKAADKITATFNSSFGVPSSPAVTPVSGFTGNCTATASASGTVVTITLVGSTCGLKNAAGTLMIAGITNPAAGSYAANTFSVSTTKDSAASPTGPVVITGGKLAFVQGPSSGYAGTPLTPAITVQVQDQAGNPVAASGVPVALTPSVGGIASGASANTDATGKATFNAVVINATALGITLIASSSGLTSTAPSTSFNVTVAVSSGATLANAPSDGGSGVKSVAYYYCAGYSGACTSANWTLIGSATAANYQVTWTGQPANGAYRVVAVSTDNVSNVSQPSGSTPVTVVN
ncbi:hypothetical protein [Kribbella sp. NPDC003557]|uniref:hypothetical protein n=1 Tax=Kribbella sp. NPDC003557 TaxID=3154449 RepID=UPI0033BA0D73